MASESFRARVKPLVFDSDGLAETVVGSYSELVGGSVRAVIQHRMVMFGSKQKAIDDHNQRVMALLEVEESK